ncbi:MAG: T9SS type A sorting domain-containing protein [Candidatus Latescibacteria bacterium]|nr:T9SS type A sorting domain-containing protein [Candidatus Latescibacterota bacterium]
MVYDPRLWSPPNVFTTSKITDSNAAPSFSSAYRLEHEGRWAEAIAMYESLLAAGTTQQKRRAITSLIRVADCSDKRYDSIKLLVQKELEKAETRDFYRAVLDQILCELELREGNFDAAIAGFQDNIEKYRGESVEAGLLARLAVIYGIHGDTSKAKEYADKAAAIDPDKLALYSAYKAAGINYEDIFTGELMNLDTYFKRSADMPTLRSAHTADVVNGKIYVIGGYGGSNEINERKYLSTIEEYDPVTDTWIPKADMPTARYGHFGGVVNGKIYAIGGAVGDYECISTVEEYDPATDTWTTKAPMPTARVYHASCSVNGKIYTVGGGTRNSGSPIVLGMVEEYDPATDTWTTKADIPTPRWGHSVCAVNGKIYAIGGLLDWFETYTGSVEEYDPATDTWTTKTPMPATPGFHAACAVNGKIYVIGGATSRQNSLSCTVEEYNPATDTWTSKFPMPVARHDFPACTVNNKIYVLGGLAFSEQRFAEVFVYDPGGGIQSFVEDSTPVEYNLLQNYPNPFNPSTTISYQLDQPCMVNLVIYDILGRKVATLLNDMKLPGSHKVIWNAEGYASGVYFYRLELGESKVLTKKMMMVK